MGTAEIEVRVHKAENVSAVSSTVDRVQLAALSGVLDQEQLSELSAAADAAGTVSIAQYTNFLRRQAAAEERAQSRPGRPSIPIAQIDDKMFGSKKAEIANALRAADKDGDGNINVEELLAVVKDDLFETYLAKRGHRRVMLLLAALFLLFVAMIGLVFGSGKFFKDTYVEEGSDAQPLLTNENGRTLATAENLESVPLLAAPALSAAALLRTKVITVSYQAAAYWGERIRRTSTVSHIVEINATGLVFELVGGAASRWNRASSASAGRQLLASGQPAASRC